MVWALLKNWYVLCNRGVRCHNRFICIAFTESEILSEVINETPTLFLLLWISVSEKHLCPIELMQYLDSLKKVFYICLEIR